MLFIFDLDGTTIDSSHRQNTLANGSLNLAHWIENNTPEKIAADSLLPMAESWKTINRQNNQIVIMTARVIGKADFKFLDMRKSLAWIRSNAYMFDDNNSVRQCLTGLGIRCYNPTSYNETKKVI
jgi:FMN phosphatase YigB (HAD superfamily)